MQCVHISTCRMTHTVSPQLHHRRDQPEPARGFAAGTCSLSVPNPRTPMLPGNKDHSHMTECRLVSERTLAFLLSRSPWSLLVSDLIAILLSRDIVQQAKKKEKKNQYKLLPFVGQELKQRIREKCIMSAGNGELLGKRAALAIFWRSCSLGLGRWKGEDGPVGHRARRSSWSSVGRGRWEAHTWDYQAFLGSPDFLETFLKLCWDGEGLGPDPTLIWKSLPLVDQKILHFTIPNRSRYKKLPIGMVMRNLMVLGQAALVTQGRPMWWVGLDHNRDSGW